jgi:hypothetical protein
MKYNIVQKRRFIVLIVKILFIALMRLIHIVFLSLTSSHCSDSK